MGVLGITAVVRLIRNFQAQSNHNETIHTLTGFIWLIHADKTSFLHLT
jgi:hypothetical protein